MLLNLTCREKDGRRDAGVKRDQMKNRCQEVKGENRGRVEKNRLTERLKMKRKRGKKNLQLTSRTISEETKERF